MRSAYYVVNDAKNALARKTYPLAQQIGYGTTVTSHPAAKGPRKSQPAHGVVRLGGHVFRLFRREHQRDIGIGVGDERQPLRQTPRLGRRQTGFALAFDSFCSSACAFFKPIVKTGETAIASAHADRDAFAGEQASNKLKCTRVSRSERCRGARRRRIHRPPRRVVLPRTRRGCAARTL